jgi:hypothetical protein
MMKYLSLILVLCLTACNFTGHRDAPPMKPDTDRPSTTADAYYTEVKGVIGDASELTTDASDFASLVATSPEDSEPTAL